MAVDPTGANAAVTGATAPVPTAHPGPGGSELDWQNFYSQFAPGGAFAGQQTAHGLLTPQQLWNADYGNATNNNKLSGADAAYGLPNQPGMSGSASDWQNFFSSANGLGTGYTNPWDTSSIFANEQLHPFTNAGFNTQNTLQGFNLANALPNNVTDWTNFYNSNPSPIPNVLLGAGDKSTSVGGVQSPNATALEQMYPTHGMGDTLQQWNNYYGDPYAGGGLTNSSFLTNAYLPSGWSYSSTPGVGEALWAQEQNPNLQGAKMIPKLQAYDTANQIPYTEAQWQSYLMGPQAQFYQLPSFPVAYGKKYAADPEGQAIQAIYPQGRNVSPWTTNDTSGSQPIVDPQTGQTYMAPTNQPVYNQFLENSRSGITSYLEQNPDVLNQWMATARDEIGSNMAQDPRAATAFFESLFNAMGAHNWTPQQALNAIGPQNPNFGQRLGTKYSTMNPGDFETNIGRFGEAFMQAAQGSNVSNFATGNASGTMNTQPGFTDPNRGPIPGYARTTQPFGGERFTQEDFANLDAWVKQNAIGYRGAGAFTGPPIPTAPQAPSLKPPPPPPPPAPTLNAPALPGGFTPINDIPGVDGVYYNGGYAFLWGPATNYQALIYEPTGSNFGGNLPGITQAQLQAYIAGQGGGGAANSALAAAGGANAAQISLAGLNPGTILQTSNGPMSVQTLIDQGFTTVNPSPGFGGTSGYVGFNSGGSGGGLAYGFDPSAYTIPEIVITPSDGGGGGE